MRTLLPLFLGLLLAVPSSFAISRIGNGNVRSEMHGFSMQVPPSYALTQDLGFEALRLINPASAFNGFGPGNLDILDVRDFATEYPAYAVLDSANLDKTLTQNSWIKEGGNNTCVKVFAKDKGDTRTVIITWSLGIGVVLVGDDRPANKQALQFMIQTLKVDKSPCKDPSAWN